MTEVTDQIGEVRPRRFRPYPEYRDSGVEWLGKIPTHWKVIRLKTMASVQLSNVDKKWRCCTARSKSLTSLCRLQSHPAQYVSGIPSAAILLSISHPIRCSTRCLANVRARISGPMIAL